MIMYQHLTLTTILCSRICRDHVKVLFFNANHFSMANDDSLSVLLGGLIGYIAGKGKTAGFESFINKYSQRLEQLKFFKIYPRMEFFNKNPNLTIVFREAILCYLFGLPNSCMPNLVRVLESALRQKYKIVTQTESSRMNLIDLIGWAETTLNINSTIAHSYRMLRNLIHTDKFVYEQDCLEGIRHVTNIIADIFQNLENSKFIVHTVIIQKVNTMDLLMKYNF